MDEGVLMFLPASHESCLFLSDNTQNYGRIAAVVQPWSASLLTKVGVD